MPDAPSRRPYTIISSDGHAGADLRDCKPYLEFLQGLADQVGFTPEQVAEPLQEVEVPDDPNFRMMLLGQVARIGGGS
jgi:hypothetical protein